MLPLTEITGDITPRAARVLEINARIEELAALRVPIDAEWGALTEERTTVQSELAELRGQLISGFEQAVQDNPSATTYEEIGAAMDLQEPDPEPEP
jgi:hypothetical protein